MADGFYRFPEGGVGALARFSDTSKDRHGRRSSEGASGSLTYYCYRCYGENRGPDGDCVNCGGAIEPPAGTAFPDLLIWALRHPVAPVATQAAAILGERKETSAAEPLRAIALESRDPFLAAAALRSLVAIQGAPNLRDLLERLAREAPLPVRRAAAAALRADSTRWERR
jgi:HEAT repeat protein